MVKLWENPKRHARYWKTLSSKCVPRHGFHPFNEIVNDHDYVFVVVVICRLAFHEINPPFVEGTNDDDRVEGS